MADLADRMAWAKAAASSLWEGEDVERQPLGGFDADAGQAGELLHQIFQCGGNTAWERPPES